MSKLLNYIKLRLKFKFFKIYFENDTNKIISTTRTDYLIDNNYNLLTENGYSFIDKQFSEFGYYKVFFYFTYGIIDNTGKLILDIKYNSIEKHGNYYIGEYNYCTKFEIFDSKFNKLNFNFDNIGDIELAFKHINRLTNITEILDE
jgi:hypothetical protein